MAETSSYVQKGRKDGGFTFVIPKGSKAIPILQPEPSTNAESSHTKAAGLLTPPSSRTGSSKSTSAASAKVAASIGYLAESERDDWAFDVYAKPFIPQSLAAINTQPGIPVNTESNRVIDYTAYAQTFAGSAFLPNRPLIPNPNFDQDLATPKGSGTKLCKRNYQRHFEDHLSGEVQAKQKENESYALYRAPLVSEQNHNMFVLHVPGLREDAPLVELGDCVQLRELRLDYQGNPVFMDLWLAPGGGASRGIQCPGWTGREYNAIVFSTNRAREMLYLKVDGLQPESLVFNVLFQIQSHRVHALRNAVAMVNEYMLPQHISSARERPQGEVTETVSEAQTSVDKKIPIKRDWMRRMLFPSKTHGVLQTTLHKIPFRRKLFDARLNFEQLKAVDSVCRNEAGTLPFLISGPPGTGKTKTLVETAMQLLSGKKVKHILMCAPSDPAADTLALRLSEHLDPSELLRLNGPSRSFPEVPGSLMPYSYVASDMFYIPPMPILMRYNIVVTTCRDATALVAGRVTNHDLHSLEMGLRLSLRPESLSGTIWEPHWGALLMDEAAQAIEPEALSPLTIIAPPPIGGLTFEPQFVMAGDHKQLGPRTASKTPSIETSLFERLFNRSLFADHPLARDNAKSSAPTPVLTKAMLPIIRPPFTNLTRNYRSHPAILAVPSSLFYHDTLIPEATDTKSLLSWKGWHGSRWPVLFACNAGLDEIERDGGGWYNKLEARMACDYALELYKSGEVMQKDICIMSPFSAQVRQLRALIREAPYQLWEVNIGPAEAFQGLESRVVILCTTRSRPRFLASDASRGLGLINMPKRTNVALTRAMHGLIVIGNPEALVMDDDWTAFLAFCARNDLWQYQVEIGGMNAQKAWCETLKTKGVIGELERQLLRERDGDSEEAGRVLGPRGKVAGEEMYEGEAAEMAGDDDAEDDDEEDDQENEIEGELDEDRIQHQSA